VNRKQHGLIFLLSGTVLILLGVIVNQSGYEAYSSIPTSLGTTVISIVLVSYLWERTGGEPILRSLEILKQSSQIVSDSMDTGLYKLYSNRRNINYEDINAEISKAKEVFIVSMVLKVVLSVQLKKSFLHCIKNGGKVRILISAPFTNEAGTLVVPPPVRLRQHAEHDLSNNRIPAEIKDAVDFLDEIKQQVALEFPERVDNFEYKVISTHVIYFSMTAIDHVIRVTHYCNKHQGLDCPTLVIQKTTSPKDLFQFYSDEFEYLWKKGEPFEARQEVHSLVPRVDFPGG